jgi:signal recognition particle subunit SRP54
MFKGLGQKLDGVFKHLSGRGVLRAEDLDLAARDIRVALLEADVALPVVRDVIARIKEKAVGVDIVKTVKPAQQVVKIVQDELIELLGGKDVPSFTVNGTPAVILMAGLQGAGKTTSSAKLAKYLTDKQRKKVLMASLDVRRPAAREQLKTLGEQINVATFPIDDDKNVASLTKRAMDMARIEAYDVLILDTAGRLSIDQEMMDEVANVHKLSNPHATLLTVDAMTGQDAVNTAQNFKNVLSLTGVILTRIDGDARGGAGVAVGVAAVRAALIDLHQPT